MPRLGSVAEESVDDELPRAALAGAPDAGRGAAQPAAATTAHTQKEAGHGPRAGRIVEADGVEAGAPNWCQG